MVLDEVLPLRERNVGNLSTNRSVAAIRASPSPGHSLPLLGCAANFANAAEAAGDAAPQSP